MPSADAETQLREFQETGNVNRLLDFVRASGRDPETYGQVLAALAPVFEPLAHGEHPRYDDLNPAEFAPNADVAAEVLRWAAASDRADLRSAALGAMGTLGWDAFTADLQAATRSPDAWERVAAIEAIGRTRSRHARQILEGLRDHPDAQAREAVRAALAAVEAGESQGDGVTRK